MSNLFSRNRFVGIGVVLLIGLFISPSKAQLSQSPQELCPPSVIYFSRPCSGNGVCLNYTCICNDGYTGDTVCINASRTDCLIHMKTFYALNWFGAVTGLVSVILMFIIMFVYNRPFHFTFDLEKMTHVHRFGWYTISCILLGSISLFMIATDHFVTNNYGTAVLVSIYSGGNTFRMQEMSGVYFRMFKSTPDWMEKARVYQIMNNVASFIALLIITATFLFTASVISPKAQVISTTIMCIVYTVQMLGWSILTGYFGLSLVHIILTSPNISPEAKAVRAGRIAIMKKFIIMYVVVWCIVSGIFVAVAFFPYVIGYWYPVTIAIMAIMSPPRLYDFSSNRRFNKSTNQTRSASNTPES